MKKKISLFNFLKKGDEKSNPNIKNTYYVGSYTGQKKLWRDNPYYSLAKDGFMDNIIVNRSISMIAKNASSVALLYYKYDQNGNKVELDINHPICKLIARPNKQLSQMQFFENIFFHFIISGNTYIYATSNDKGTGVESLDVLRPDRVTVSPMSTGEGLMYEYSIDNSVYKIPIENNNSNAPLLHLKNFHPLDDYCGFSSLQAAISVVEQYNECIKWNKSLVKNGARPSGAIVVKNENGNGGALTDEQFEQIREQLNNHSGQENAGKILILEGGLDWKEMSVSPKDMEFLETKNGAARDIALSLGMPPQLLGIRGDNTYSNVAEARLAFWEETVLPLLNSTLDSLSKWISNLFQEEIEISYDIDLISALSEKRSKMWKNVQDSNFVTEDEKREIFGFGSNKNETQNETQEGVKFTPQ
ncbi:MAG: phage portal protein [Alphaproteobacteria bacterium]|nr:phage portal protein [Rickettsiales bacterium]